MDYAEISAKVSAMQSSILEMLSQEDLEPAIRAGLEATEAHVKLLCIELGLDVQ